MPERLQTDFLQKIFPRAYSEPVGVGSIKCAPEDFIVDEELSFPFTGEGEHAYLKIRKTNQNTMWVVGVLSKYFSVKESDIGYAGLKDRRAVTTQWFSLLAKHATQDKIERFKDEGIEIIDVQRHSGKLRRGAIKHNRFKIIVRELDAGATDIQARLQVIARFGVPNYFDEQRFGRQRQNLNAAEKLFTGKLRPKKNKRRIYLSAARSWLFNIILAARINQDCWATGLDGDVFMLDGSKRFFHEAKLDDSLVQRLEDNDIHPTAPLWGEGDIQSSSGACLLEQEALADWDEWCQQLEGARMKQQRRATRVVPAALEYDYDPEQARLTISFELPPGSYATNLLRELITLTQID